MRKDDISIGGTYKVAGQARSCGKAVVTGPAEKVQSQYQWEKSVYKFPVEYPDTIENDKPKTGQVQSRDFVREWTEHDENLFQEQMAIGDRLDRIRDALSDAGYEPTNVRSISNGQLWISYDGDKAEQLVEKLVGKIP